MENFDPLAAEIVSLVWDTPANFNGFRVFSFVTAATSLNEANQTLHDVCRLLRGYTIYTLLAAVTP